MAPEAASLSSRQELVDGAGSGEFIEPPEGCDDGLLDALSFAAVFRDLKILIRADFLDADEHEASPSLTPHILRRLSREIPERHGIILAIPGQNLPLHIRERLL